MLSFKLVSYSAEPISLWIDAETFRLVKIAHFCIDECYVTDSVNPTLLKLYMVVAKMFSWPCFLLLILHDGICCLLDKYHWIYIIDGYRYIEIMVVRLRPVAPSAASQK